MHDNENGMAVIHNRDIPILEDVFPIMQEICQIERQREWQRDRMVNITQHITGMTGGGRTPKGLDAAFSVLSELDTEHEMRCLAYTEKLRRAEEILNSIGNQTVRTFVLMKYVMHVNDVTIRDELNMTRTAFNKLRQHIESAESMKSVKWQAHYMPRKG